MARVIFGLNFAADVGIAAYLLTILSKPDEQKMNSLKIEALKLEHQSCMTLFQTCGSLMGIFFLATFIAPLLNANVSFANVRFVDVMFLFYSLAGFILWILFPCVERAERIRRQLQRSEERMQAHTAN